MPSKKQYERLKADNRCPKCGNKLDDVNFITCSKCRKQGSVLNKKYKKQAEIRQGAMNLFGINRHG